jgi:hypothetical protein
MRRLRDVTVAMLFVFGSLSGTRASSQIELTAQDYADIQQLYATYAHGFDSKVDDGQMYIGVFADDASFEDQYDLQTVGRDSLLARYGHTQSGHANPVSNSHSTWNVMIEPAPWGAVGRAYKSMGISFAADGTSVWSGVPGMYYDVLVKGPSGWRFKQRIFRQEFARPAQSAPASGRNTSRR